MTDEEVAEVATKAATEANARQAAEERRNVGATFEKAVKYGGPKVGRVFQLGAAGLGYYADCGHIVKLDLAKSLSSWCGSCGAAGAGKVDPSPTGERQRHRLHLDEAEGEA